MDDLNTSIKNYSNITVASNELFLRATINRNLEKLIENDVYLKDKIASYGTTKDFSIQIYKESKTYNKGDAIIFPEFNEDKTRILNIYILDCIEDRNAKTPSYKIVDDFIKDFSESGWKDPNPFLAIYNSADDSKTGLAAFLESAVSGKFSISHDNDLKYHKFGVLKDETDLSSKLLLNDFSNISDERKSLFWAYKVGRIDSKTYNGTYKKWGNGVIEYDLTFSLDSEEISEKTIAEDGSISIVKYVKANSLIPLSNDNFNNDDYFLNAEAYAIFNKKGTAKKYNVGGILQTNVSEQTNVYHGKIEFPIPFYDENYMVFVSGTTSDIDGKSQSLNTIVFTNKRKDSITPLLVIPNYNNIIDMDSILLRNNTFQCQIIGRWKEK